MLELLHVKVTKKNKHEPYGQLGARKITLPFCIFTGTEGNIEKWRSCVGDTGQTLGFALGHLFVKSAFHGASRVQVGCSQKCS